MPPPVAAAQQVSPEEKRARRVLTSLITINSISAVLLLASIGVGVMLMMTKLNVRAPKPVEDKGKMPGPAMVLTDQVYNLGEMNHYVKAAITVELSTEGLEEKELGDFVTEAKARMPFIEDLVISEMSGKTFRDVSTPEGKEQLKEELRVKINALLDRGQVKEVIFTSFAAQ
ncbi:MAG: flagellar basal body-associated FliL family protein [Candidatus Coatesbacteria bacterium]